MSLFIQRLEIHISTSEGLFGVKIPFDQGLVVIWADNSMGKSTCLLSILYALGLEGMLGPKKELPFTHVMTKVLEDEHGKELPVLEAAVFLEVKNHRNEVMTIKRAANVDEDNSLVQTWNGPALSEKGQSFGQSDYFVRQKGAAVREKGFHHYLAAFLGWDLPLVARFDRSEYPLYMECIFPLAFVEQKHGWSGIQPNLMGYLQIKDVRKRAVEFVLGLEAYDLILRRERLEREEAELKVKWSNLREEYVKEARSLLGRVSGISVKPTTQWPPAIEPLFEISEDGTWLPIGETIRSVKEKLGKLESIPIPTAEQSSEETLKALNAAQQMLSDQEFLANELLQSLEREEAQMMAIKQRLGAINEDLLRYQDIQKLKKLGSSEELSIKRGKCPTCDQAVADSLFSQESLRQSMTVEENIEFLKEQKAIFQRMETGAKRNVYEKESQLNIVREELKSLRAEIRACKRTLTSSSSSLSYAAVRERILLEERMKNLVKGRESFEESLESFSAFSDEWTAIQEQKATLPEAGLSDADLEKLSKLKEILVEQEEEYGFSSFDPSFLQISQETYKPSREGFDIGFEASASDNIRIIWGYLLGLLEVSRTEPSANHPGLLILDEPKQQSAKDLSFKNLLKRASKAKEFGQQVIFATSEKRESLEESLRDVDCAYRAFDGKMMKRL